MDLKPCQCGETPTELIVSVHSGEYRPKLAHCCGDCCGEWEIQFLNDGKPIGSAESYAKAADAWNSAPRATKQPAQGEKE